MTSRACLPIPDDKEARFARLPPSADRIPRSRRVSLQVRLRHDQTRGLRIESFAPVSPTP